MSTQLIEYALPDGQTICVEVEDGPVSAVRGGRDSPVTKAQESFESAVSRIRPAAEALINGLKGLTPEEISLEMSLKFTAKAGVVIASADSEAAFKVTLKWKPAA